MMARPGDLLLPSLGVWTAACAAVGASVPLTWVITGSMAAVACWGILIRLRLKNTWVSPAWIGGWRGWGRFLVGWPPTVFLVLGVTACFLAHRSAFPDSPRLDAWVGQRIRIEAEVTSVLSRSRDGETAVVEVIRVWDETADGFPRSGGRTPVSIRLPAEVLEGDQIIAWVRLRLPPVPPAPYPEGVRDPWEAAERFYRADLGDDSDLAVNPTWRSASQRIRAVLERVWAGSVEQRAAALLNAMVLGDEAGLDPRVTDAFALTGVAHVVAVSGAHLHVLIWPLRKWLEGRMRPGKRLWILGGTASLYAWITGASPSAVRAAAMVWYAETASVLGRSVRPLHAWGATLTAEVFMDPEWVFDLGFQLSYAATWGIFVLEPALRNALRPVPRWLRIPLAGSLAAEIATCPISFSTFHVWNGWTLLANIWVPAVGSAVLVCGLLSLLVAPIPLLGSWTIWVAGYLSEWVVRGVLAMDGDRRWLFELGPLPSWMWGLYLVGILVCVGWGGARRRAGFGLMVLFSATILASASLLPQKVVLFSLGQERAVFTEVAGRRELICPDRIDEVETLVLPYLKRMGVHVLDRIWVASPGEEGDEATVVSFVDAVSRRMVVHRGERWDRNHVLHVRLAGSSVFIRGWPVTLLIPDQLAVDIGDDEPFPGRTGRERTWHARGQGGLLIEERFGNVYYLGGSGAPRVALDQLGLMPVPGGFQTGS